MERRLLIGPHRFTEVKSTDEKGDGGVHHVYEVASKEDEASAGEVFAWLTFQKGPVGENDVNGCFMEDLLAICIDRLQCFQAGDFACRENALALTKLQEAMHWLNHRTLDRQQRGVEGTSER